MNGKICLITGASSGIGKQTALGLARKGATVIIVNRDRARGEAALADIKAGSGNNNVELMLADLSSMAEVHALAERVQAQYHQLDLLINNAGIVATERIVTTDGFESTFAVNHLAPFLLTNLLLDLLKATPGARIVNLASQVHAQQIDFENLQAEKSFVGLGPYRLSKLANIMFTYELARRLDGSDVVVNCLHPGVINTDLLGNFNKLWALERGESVAEKPKRGLLSRVRSVIRSDDDIAGESVEDAANNVLYLATSSATASVTGKYWRYGNFEQSNPISYDEDVAARLWDVSAELTGLNDNDALPVAAEASAAGEEADFATEEDDEEVLAFPASFAQQRLWFVDQLEPGKATYNIPYHHHVRISGPLNVDALQEAVTELINRHETLRTTFFSQDGEPVQLIHDEIDTTMPLIDLSHLPEMEREAEGRRIVDAEAKHSFDLENGPLFYTKLVKMGQEDHIFIHMMSHIVVDGMSLEFIADEIEQMYAAFCKGQSNPLPELPLQYPDFVIWHREWMDGPVPQKQLAYWKEQLSGRLPVMELPTDRPRPAVQKNNGSWEWIHLKPELIDGLKQFSRNEGVSLFMTMLAAFKVLMHRYSRQEDIIVGTPTANRNQPELEKLIAFFVNPVVFRTDMAGDPAFNELLKVVRKVALGAFAHQDIPFERLVEELRPTRDLSYNPIFQVSFTLQMSPALMQLEGTTSAPMEFDNGTARFDLLAELWEADGGVSGRFEYDTDLFDKSTIRRMIDSYATLLESIVAEPAGHISRLNLLPEPERQQVLYAWNQTEKAFPRDARLHDLIEATVAANPDKVAVQYNDTQLTYGDLNRRANQLAHHLLANGVERGDLIGLSVARSAEMMIGLLGIMKAGGAYLPLDPEYPLERLHFILEDAQAPLLITQEKLRGQWDGFAGKIVAIDSDWDIIATHGDTNLNIEMSAEDLVYIIHTSGSTGKPKGVQLRHRNVVNFLTAMREKPGLTADDTLMAVTTLSFDIAVLELYLPLIVGAKVIIASPEINADGGLMARTLESERVTVMQATPASWKLMLNTGWEGKADLKILCGGEELPRELAEQLIPRGAELWNMYGPTETTVWSAAKKIVSGDGPVPIGEPIANTQLYILDQNLQPTPIGVPGELCIGGDGVAAGYLNRPELTADRFVNNPFVDDPQAMLYRVGDLARYRPDGTIEFLGRIDFQVKVRGFRIELGEIETVLRQYADVREGVVTAQDDPNGDKRLVAYIIPEPGSEPTTAAMRDYLAESLPAYMVPTLFLSMDEWPLTPNGKIDRRALPSPSEASIGSAESYVAPRNEVEDKITIIWSEILGLEKIGVEDNFFELGGHSLLATQIIARVNKAFDVTVPLPAMFANPFIAGLAEQVATAQLLNDDTIDEEDGEREEFVL